MLLFHRMMKLYPEGHGVGLGSGYLSLYIALADPATLPPSSKINAQIILRILHHQYTSYNVSRNGKVLFSFYYWLQFPERNDSE